VTSGAENIGGALATGAPASRPRGGSRGLGWLTHAMTLRVLSLAAVLGLWQLFGNQFSTSFPDQIARAFPHAFWHEVMPALGDTMKGLGAGYAVCIVAGVPIGLLMSRSRVIELALEPYVTALYATPRLALIPILILWLGIDFRMRFAVVVVSGLFPIILNTYIGGKEVDRNLLDAGVAFAAGPFQMLRTIVVPASLPYIFAGLRLGLARAFIGIIVAEIETSVLGIGNLINHDAQILRFQDMWVAIITLGILSILLTTAIKRAERWATMPWARGRGWRLWPSRA
jgi:NitT/TauT family transport system permease protein